MGRPAPRLDKAASHMETGSRTAEEGVLLVMSKPASARAPAGKRLARALVAISAAASIVLSLGITAAAPVAADTPPYPVGSALTLPTRANSPAEPSTIYTPTVVSLLAQLEPAQPSPFNPADPKAAGTTQAQLDNAARLLHGGGPGCAATGSNAAPVGLNSAGVVTSTTLSGNNTTLSVAANIGDLTVTVASATGWATGQAAYIDFGPSAESVGVASVAASVITLSAPLTKAHAVGASITNNPVAFAGATNLKVAAVTGFADGQTIWVDTLGPKPESAVIAVGGVGTVGSAGTGITLTAPLAFPHVSGATVAILTTPAISPLCWVDALGINASGGQSRKTTAPPLRLGMSSSFDAALFNAWGQVEGAEGRALGITGLYGPQVDLTRYPNWSRNDTNFGEDLFLDGTMSAAEVNGVQGAGLMDQMKHFTNYNGQGNTPPAIVQDQAEHELYLSTYEYDTSGSANSASPIKNPGNAAAMMCSYVESDITAAPGVASPPSSVFPAQNVFGDFPKNLDYRHAFTSSEPTGAYSCENPLIQNTIVRGMWGWKGFFASDYGATHSTSINQGLDQEMSSSTYMASTLTAAVVNGTESTNGVGHGVIPLSVFNQSVARILYQQERFGLLGHSNADSDQVSNSGPITSGGTNQIPCRTVDASCGATSTLSAASAVGDVTVLVASSTGFAAGNRVWIDTGANQEVAVVHMVSGVPTQSVTLTTTLTKAHALGATITSSVGGAVPSTPQVGIKEDDAAIVEKASEEAAVLLKNDSNTLPLKSGDRVLVVGASAEYMPADPGSERSNGYRDRDAISPLEQLGQFGPAQGVSTTYFPIVSPDVAGGGTLSTTGDGRVIPASWLSQDAAGTIPGLANTLGAPPAAGNIDYTSVSGQGQLAFNTTYQWDGYVNVPGTDTYDFRFQFTVPAGGSITGPACTAVPSTTIALAGTQLAGGSTTISAPSTTLAGATTTATAALSGGVSTITVVSITGFSVGQTVTIDVGPNQETGVIASTISASPNTLASLVLASGLAGPHPSGSVITNNLATAGSATIKVTAVTNFAAGQSVAIDTGAALETRVIAAVGTAGLTGTGLTLTTALSGTHTGGAAVAGVMAAGATNIKTAGSGPITGFNVGDVIWIDTGALLESATISAIGTAGVTGTGITLTTPLAFAHANGAAVRTVSSIPGATNIKVASVTGFNVGDPIAIDTGTALETSTVTAVGTSGATGTGITLATALLQQHYSGAAVNSGVAAGATNLKVASVGNIVVGSRLQLDTGTASFEVVTVTAVGTATASGTGVTVTPATAFAHYNGASVTQGAPTFYLADATGAGQPLTARALAAAGSAPQGTATNPTMSGYTERGLANCQTGALTGLAAGRHQVRIIFTTSSGFAIDTSNLREPAPNAPTGPSLRFAYSALAKDSADVVAAAASYDKIVVFADGGFGSGDVNQFSANVNNLVTLMVSTGKPVAVVLHVAVPTIMPWKDQVKSILMTWYPGGEGGTANARLLLGLANPGGHTPMVWEADTTQTIWGYNQPYPLYPGDTTGTHPNRNTGQNIGGVNAYRWTEGIYIGYRYIDKMADLGAPITPAFPWGWGLSYTTFSFSNLHVASAGAGYDVRFDITNTGPVAGAQVGMVFLGAAPNAPAGVQQAVRALRGFVRAELNPGQTVTRTIHIGPGPDVDGYGDPRAFQYWDTPTQSWATLDGCRTLWVGDADTTSRLPLTGTTGVCSPTTTLAADFDPTQYGKPVTFTATITGNQPNPPVPTGTVQFKLDGANAGTPVALDAGGNATWTTSTIAIGTHVVAADYSGDASYGASSATISHSVKKRLATTAAVSSPGFGFGAPWTLAAQVIPENASSGFQPTGTLEVMDNGKLLSTGTPPVPVKLHLPDDTVTTADFTITIHCTWGPPLSCTITITWTASGARSAGNHNVRVVYSGDTNYTGSTSPTDVQQVKKATATGAVTSVPPSPITYGTRPIFTATFVNPVAPAGTLTGGNVQFLIDGTNMGPLMAISATPTGGTATFTPTWNLPSGKHTIKARYTGNTNFLAVFSAPYTLVINP